LRQRTAGRGTVHANNRQAPHARDTMSFLEALINQHRDYSWPELVAQVWHIGLRANRDAEIAELLNHPDHVVRRVAQVLKGDVPVHRMYCTECGGRTQCSLIEDCSSLTHTCEYPTQTRLCRICGRVFVTAEIDEQLLAEYVRLREMLEKIELSLAGREQAGETSLADAQLKEMLKPYYDFRSREQRLRFHSQLLSSFDLSIRAHNVLDSANIETIDQLCEHSAEELLALRGMRQKELDEMRTQLAKRNRRLRGD
jgi:hypothetical protein